MDFTELQQKVIENAKRYGERFGVRIDQEFAILKLIEEVGEFAEAVLTHDKKSRPEKLVSAEQAKESIATELADVVGMAIVAADIFKVDLEKAVQKKWMKEIPKG